MEARFLVDSGVVFTVVPESLWRRLRLTPQRTAEFTLADGTTITRGVSECRFTIQGQTATSPVVLGGPGDAARARQAAPAALTGRRPRARLPSGTRHRRSDGRQRGGLDTVVVPAMPDAFITTSRTIGRWRWACRMAWRRAGFTTWCYERHSVPGLSYLNQTGQAIEDGTISAYDPGPGSG